MIFVPQESQLWNKTEKVLDTYGSDLLAPWLKEIFQRLREAHRNKNLSEYIQKRLCRIRTDIGFATVLSEWNEYQKNKLSVIGIYSVDRGEGNPRGLICKGYYGNFAEKTVKDGWQYQRKDGVWIDAKDEEEARHLALSEG